MDNPSLDGLTVQIDLTAVTVQGGIGRYVREMLPRLVEGRPDWKWGGYAHLPINHLSALGIQEHHLITSDWPGNVGRLMTQTLRLPGWARADTPDIFWGPAHRLPHFLPASTTAVLTIHDLLWLVEPQTMRPVTRWLDTRLMPRALRRADRIIAVSQSTARDIQRFFPLVSEKVEVIHEGVSNFDRLLPAESLRSLGIAGRYVLCVGTMEPRKNLHRLLSAFASLNDVDRQAVEMVIVGGAGWGKSNCLAEVSRLGISGKVHLLGSVSDELLATLYKNALCLILPSLYEGFGLPVVEAMSMGTPVLVSNRSALPEVAGEGGLFFDPMNVRDIAGAIANLIGDESMRSILAAAALKQSKRFSWTGAAKRMISVMQASAKAGNDSRSRRSRTAFPC